MDIPSIGVVTCAYPFTLESDKESESVPIVNDCQ